MSPETPSTVATVQTLITTLRDIALLLELKGENPFKVRAYRSGADTIENFDPSNGDILQRARDNQLKGIKGIGSALQDKLHTLANSPDGTLPYHQDLRAEFPETLFELFRLQGLGPKKIKALYELRGVDSIGALKEQCLYGLIAELPGFGKKTEEKILASIHHLDLYADRHRLATAAPLVETLLEELRQHPDVHQAAIAGSYRRNKETLHDLDFIVATDKPAELTAWFTSHHLADSIISQGDTKAAIRIPVEADNATQMLQCDLRAVTNAQFPFTLQYFTGSKEHNVALRSLALKKGLTLNEYGLAPTKDGKKDPTSSIHTEEDIYAHLGLQAIPPALRENRGEIEAAKKNTIPKLIQLGNLKGTVHAHTTASDGRNTLEEMSQAAQDLGLDYLGITDHSKTSVVANGLNEERLLAQIENIKTLNTSYEKEGNTFRLLTGSEVDILKDGSLDFDDDLLAQLDITIASIHQPMSMDEDTMTKRIIKAVENPHVKILGHPSGRLLLVREAYPMNLTKIIDACAANGTAIELNAKPKRYDLDWRHWKYAVEKGVKCLITPDAHSITDFQNLSFGIRIAQKGWLTKEHILNTLSYKKLLSRLKHQ